MQLFQYKKVSSVNDALVEVATSGTKFVAGGTTLIDLMKLDVERPTALVDINSLPLDQIEEMRGGGLKIGAMVRNSDLAHDARVQQRYPVLSQALLSGASPQLRNMATTGGNLLQRTRCYYFRDTDYPCNKRQPDSGCSAVTGYNRIHAVLGTSEHCIATHPSDMAVAMAALDAIVHFATATGTRSVPITQFFLVPGDTPNRETVLAPQEIITHVSLPALPAGSRSLYLKRRDRASYEFALASAAVVLEMNGRKIHNAQLALGGVATVPWRAHAAERVLAGSAPTDRAFRHAAELALQGAKPQQNNAFKIELAKRTIVRALQNATSA